MMKNVETILIHTFSYSFGNQPETVLINDYDENFWMQGEPNYNELYADTQPIQFLPDAEITVDIKFTLNGNYYEFEGQMPSARRKGWSALLTLENSVPMG